MSWTLLVSTDFRWGAKSLCESSEKNNVTCFGFRHCCPARRMKNLEESIVAIINCFGAITCNFSVVLLIYYFYELRLKTDVLLLFHDHQRLK